MIHWPASATNFMLEQADGLGKGVQWSPVQANPALTNGRFEILVPATAPQKFFRLRSVQP